MSINSGVISHILQSLASMDRWLRKLDTSESINISLRGEMSKVQTKVEELTGQISHFSAGLSK